MVINKIQGRERKGYDGKVWKKDSKIQSADSDSQYFIIDSVCIGVSAYEN